LPFLRRYFPFITIALAIASLYLHNVDAVGVLGPDEPRYAAIGRAMALSHDFVTPQLWGQPWFEKPPLLYWLAAAGTASGLNMDLAGRIPVALLSLSFLLSAFVLVKREFGMAASASAIAMLSTSVGWLAYSTLCVTDIPLAVFFSLALILALPLAGSDRSSAIRLVSIGVSLALATLAKGLVPLALFLPALYFLRKHWRGWWLIAAGFLPVALPWYLAMYARFGWSFVNEFFIRHHLQRLYSTSLQHVQPWYYYIPVVVAALFPWTPGLLLLKKPYLALDKRRQLLLTTVIFGLVLFSISLNKLPGYILPILPSLFILIGSCFERRPVSRIPASLLLPSAALIAGIPLLLPLVAASLSAGRFTPATAAVSKTAIFYICLPFAIVALARRSFRAPLLVLSLVAMGLFAKAKLDPILEQTASARSVWRSIPAGQSICDAGTRRDWIYGLSFYSEAAIPGCRPGDGKLRISSSGHGHPVLSAPAR
jgi:4-amino-4-deoxy-L-arabinose transferase-like glycosyltransferase